MYVRTAETIIKEFSKMFPAVVIVGPRQSGKTTLARTMFPHLPYLTFEDFDIRSYATKDPRGFLLEYRAGAILDEVQNVPQLLSYLQGVLDSNREKGRFVLTGSHNLLLNSQISQSLPGRVGIVTLLPLSVQELAAPGTSVYSYILNGGYPALHMDKLKPAFFYPGYIATYLERDVRQLKNISNLATFRDFIKLCASRVGQLLNVSSLANDCGIAPSTATEWLNLLEASYIIFMLSPYHKNFGKRTTKMSKIYFYDTGLASLLLEIHTEEQLKFHYCRGGLFENLVVLELLKGRLNKGLPPSLYFWRESNGKEVDIVADWGGPLRAIEIKSSLTMGTNDNKNLVYFKELVPDTKSYVLYAAHQSGSYKGNELISLEAIHKLLD